MNNELKQPNIKDSILERLESENIAPTSRWKFTCLNCWFWILWLITVLVGAVAVGVVLCIALINSMAFREATHDSWWQFWFEAMPYVWIVMFVGMSIAAYYNFRNTRRGYRHNPGVVIVGGLLLSVVGGTIVHESGFGYKIDKQMGSYVPMYESLEERELKLWQVPKAGRLVGVAGAQRSEMEIEFIDVDGVVWNFDIAELAEADRTTLLAGKQVKVLAIQASGTRAMYACGAFPWMLETAAEIDDLSFERQAFLERMYAHKDSAERLEALGALTYEERNMGQCAKMPVIPRITESME